MNFEVGDELVYNASIADLPPAIQRQGDWGRVTKISNGYIHFRFNYGHTARILPGSFTYSPRSPKYIKMQHQNVLLELPRAFTAINAKRIKKTYQTVLRDVVHIVLSKNYKAFISI